MIKEYELYQNGVAYNNSLEPSFYDEVDCNWDFVYSKQWRNAKLDSDKPAPVFNYLNRFATFFIASIMSSNPKVKFASVVDDDTDDTDAIINSVWDEFADRVKLSQKASEALWDGCVTGDYIGHMIFDVAKKPYDGKYGGTDGQIDFELVSPTNFYMANANTNDVQGQKYIQVVGRALVSDLKEEQKEVGELNEEISEDNNDDEQIGHYGELEMEGEDSKKATYVITYRKKDGKVYATKCTESAYVYKNIDTGCTMYPVSLGNWIQRRNTYHGHNFVTGLVDTQIFINKAFSAAMYHAMLQSFPKFVYNPSLIAGYDPRVTAQYGVNLGPGQSINDVAGYIAPANMSGDLMNMVELAKTYMQEAVGANDALLGNVNPEQASGTSIATASKQAGIPLEIPMQNMYNWYEDLGRIFLDMIAYKFGTRPVAITDGDNAEMQMYDFDQLQEMYKTPKVDVGPSSYWSELAEIQTLDNLLEREQIDFIEYLDRLPEGFVRNKNGLIKKRKELQEKESIRQQELAALTPEAQNQYLSMKPEQQEMMMNATGI